MSAIATAISILNGIITFFKSMFGKKGAEGVEDANTQAVATENMISKESVDISRNVQATIDKVNQDADNIAADRHSQLAAAHGLRARAAVLDATRDSADSSTGSGS